MKSLLVASLAAGAVLAAPSSTLATRQTATKVKYAGANIAGFDFGCATDGTCSLSGTSKPLDIVALSSAIPQMQHFVNDDKFNAFRLPVGWQYLTNGQLGGNLNSANLARYDALVQGCLSSGASLCIIDIHNYARWNGQIIGQGGPTNDQFVALWTALATKYASQSKIAFGVMNEPHDVPDITKWAATVQAVVTAIRNAGAKTQMILMPSNNWTSAATIISSGSGAALLTVKNPDGTTDGLIFDSHKYLDIDNSGTHTECVTDNIDGAFSPLATWLRTNKRQALLSETGGGNTASCQKYMCQQLKYLNQNADVYLGYTGWSAGGFASTYELNETPTKNGNSWSDTSLVTQCMAGVWKSS